MQQDCAQRSLACMIGTQTDMMCMMYAAVAALAIAAHGGGEEDEWRTVYSYGVGTTYANGAAAAVARNVRVLDAPSDQRRGSVTGPRVHEPVDPATVKVVHLIQSNHLDIGFSE
jgi:hypothetical protein